VFAQELQGNVPGFGRGPAQIVRLRMETGHCRRKLANDDVGQWNSDEEAHKAMELVAPALV
jgi:hypothetical protein